MDQKTLVKTQFGDQAQSYLTSQTHAQGEDLSLLRAYLSSHSPHRVLDLGCGAGHVSFLAAEFAQEVISYDMSDKMLDIVGRESKTRGFNHIRLQQGMAESIAIDTHSVDLVITRFSAHHWQDVPQALQEIRRVLKPNGGLIVIDIIADEHPLFDTLLQTVEILRDPSHVRDYRQSEWQHMLTQAGFEVNGQTTFELRMAFEDWVRRSNTNAQRVAMIQHLWQDASSEVHAFFKLESDASFVLRSAYLEASLL